MSQHDVQGLEPARDHRRLGRELELFSFEDAVGPGLALWHPKGALVRHLLEDYWRKEQIARGYQLVYSPHLGRSVLWEASGHLDFYRDSMFPSIETDEQSYFVKPMNCPFHMQIFASRPRSYRELPLRLAELGTVYRYERSGVLTGLLRVRGFTQDDAHIFCREDDLESEIADAVRFVSEFLARFEFRLLSFSLSTRPSKSVGDTSEWEAAEAGLARAVQSAGLDHEVDAGGGAFYGPKLDVHVEDSLGREWQLSTVQLDFNLPRRFGLSYVGADGAATGRSFFIERSSALSSVSLPSSWSTTEARFRSGSPRCRQGCFPSQSVTTTRHRRRSRGSSARDRAPSSTLAENPFPPGYGTARSKRSRSSWSSATARSRRTRSPSARAEAPRAGGCAFPSGWPR